MLGRGVEKHLQANQGNKPNIQYILEVGIPMLNSKQDWPLKIHNSIHVKNKKCIHALFDECKISRYLWCFDMVV